MVKRGRTQKKSIGSTSYTPFQIDKFCDVLLSTLVSFPDSNVKSWSLKKEWSEFTKTYFEITRVTERNVRGSYDFFKRNERDVTSLLQSKRSVGFSKDDRMPHLIFPNLKTMEGSIFLVNCENVSLGGEYLGSKQSGKVIYLNNPNPSVRISTEETCGSTHPSFPSELPHNEQDDISFSQLKACEQSPNISAASSSEPNSKFNMCEIPPISPIKLKENSNFRENPTLSSQFPEDQNQIHSSGHPSPSIAEKRLPRELHPIYYSKGHLDHNR